MIMIRRRGRKLCKYKKRIEKKGAEVVGNIVGTLIRGRERSDRSMNKQSERFYWNRLRFDRHSLSA